MNDLQVIKYIKNIGVAEEKLRVVLDSDLFLNLSKHNPFWDSEDPLISEKLYDIRMKLSFLNDQIYDAYSLINISLLE